MPRRATIHFVSLHSSLINLPISIYGPLLERSVRPQNLAVHLALAAPETHVKVEAYVGWTGMASASSLAHLSQLSAGGSGEKGFETIEIDPQYAQSLGFKQGDLVDIGLLHDLPFASSVATEPWSSDDWEIIEIHASHIESTLLSQVRVAKIGQEIDVWVLGRTRVRLKVVSAEPQSKANASLLTTNTEVSIAPKLRGTHDRATSAGSSLKNKDSKSAPAVADRTSGVSASKSSESKKQPQMCRVLPRQLSSPRVKARLDTYTGNEIIAYASPITMIQLLDGCTPLQAANRITDLKDGAKHYKVVIKRLEPPVDPSAQAPASSPPPSSPLPRVLNPANVNDKPDETGVTRKGGSKEVYLGWAIDVPDNHVVFHSLIEGIDEWDLVRVAQAADEETFDISGKTVNNESPPQETAQTGSSQALAGIDDILKKCTNFCINKLMIHKLPYPVRGISALLVIGRPGVGKTSIIQHVARSLQEDPRTLTYIHQVDLSRYSEKPVSTIKSLFQYTFAKAAWHRPSIIILDNLDKLLSAEVEHADSFRSRQLAELFVAEFSASHRPAAHNFRGILLLATAVSMASLHPLMNTVHMFGEIVNVKPPTRDARRDILTNIIQNRLAVAQHVQQDPENPINCPRLATQTEGYLATDLHDLVSRAMHQVAIRAFKDKSPPVLRPIDFEAAQKDFIPLSLRDVPLQKSDVAWSDIGGLYEPKRVLRETLEWPTKYGPIFAQSPLRLRSGLLLYGFPGCGKTMLASAVAKECGLNFISVKGPELLNKYIGASEKSVRDLFERASSAKPCVLFFDEFDSIAPKRGHDSTGVTDRVVNQMLTQMDGAEGLDGVYVLAATSRPDLIDPALLRPGRLDKSILCDMPNLQERTDILKAVAQKVKMSPNVDFGFIAGATDGFSGADLQALIYNAHLEVVHESIASLPTTGSRSLGEEVPIRYSVHGGSKVTGVMSKADEMDLQRRLRQIKNASGKQTEKTSKSPPPKHEVTEEHIRKVLKTAHPSVSLEEQQRLHRIYQAFVGSRSGPLPVPPDSSAVGSRVSLM